MKKLNAFIIGAGGQARVVSAILKDDYSNIYNIKKIYNLAKTKYKADNELDINITYLEDLKLLEKGKNNHYFLAFGDSKKRSNLYDKCVSLGLQLPNLISKKAIIHRSATFGRGNFVLPLAHIGPHVSIGNNSIINTGGNLEHEVIIGNHCDINPGSIICGRSVIKDKVKVGANAVVVENLKINKETIIGAGSVVLKSIKKNGQKYLGVPAKQVKSK